MTKVLAAITLWMLLATFGCVACVDALLPATPRREIAAPEVSAEGVLEPVENVSPGGSLSRIGSAYHPPYAGWAEINMEAAEREAAIAAAEAARPEPPVVVVNVEVRQPRRHYHRDRAAQHRGAHPSRTAPAPGSNAGRF